MAAPRQTSLEGGGRGGGEGMVEWNGRKNKIVVINDSID